MSKRKKHRAPASVSYQLDTSGKKYTVEADEAFWRFAWGAIARLGEGKLHVVGCGFTPRSCRAFLKPERVPKSLEEAGVECRILEGQEGIAFEVTSAEQLLTVVRSVHWATWFVLRLADAPVDQVDVPPVKRRWRGFSRGSLRWFVEHLSDWPATVFLKAWPIPQFEAMSLQLAAGEIQRVCDTAMADAGFSMSTAQIGVTVASPRGSASAVRYPVYIADRQSFEFRRTESYSDLLAEVEPFYVEEGLGLAWDASGSALRLSAPCKRGRRAESLEYYPEQGWLTIELAPDLPDLRTFLAELRRSGKPLPKCLRGTEFDDSQTAREKSEPQ